MPLNLIETQNKPREMIFKNFLRTSVLSSKAQ